MRKTALLLLLPLLATGCIRSLHPIYTPQSLTYDQAFLGAWAHEKDGSRLEIAPGPTDDADAVKSYRVVYTDKDGKSARLLGHLAKVGDLLVADLTVADEEGLPDSDFYRAHLFPLHTFWVVSLSGDELTISAVQHEWMKQHLDARPAAVAHYRSNEDIVLTASPEEMQKFLLAHAKDSGMLSEGEVFRRRDGKKGKSTNDRQ